MAALLAALRELEITAGVELNGRWVTIHGERGTASIIEAGWGSSFYVWSDIPEERAVSRHTDAAEAIQDALRRAGDLAGTAASESSLVDD